MDGQPRDVVRLQFDLTGMDAGTDPEAEGSQLVADGNGTADGSRGTVERRHMQSGDCPMPSPLALGLG